VLVHDGVCHHASSWLERVGFLCLVISSGS